MLQLQSGSPLNSAIHPARNHSCHVGSGRSHISGFQPALRVKSRDRRSCIVRAAKKGKKGGQKKGGSDGGGSGIPQAGATRRPYTDTEVVMQNLLLVESFARKLGRPIMEEADIADVARLLFEADFAVLAHDAADDPVFTYANQTALDLFEAEWDDLVGKPSRNSAEDADEAQSQRNELLKEAMEKGHCSGNFGWRQSLTGNRFLIRDGILWSIDAPSGNRVGQAALFTHWELADGSQAGPGAPVDEGDLETAEAAVAEQAEVVRGLKEQQGLGNQDEQVVKAVEELKARKLKVERLQDAARRMAEPAAVN